MKKVKIASFVVLGIALIIAAVFLVFNLLKPKVSGLYIETNPLATVYIDGVEDGRTPYDRKDKKPGEVVIKLVPDSFSTPLAPYEAKVNLVAGVKTVIKRDFGDTEETSSGEIVSFEKIDKNQVSLAIVSIPDSAELLIDGGERAFTPHRTTSILPGNHSLLLKAQGYQERKVDVKTHEGYKLTAIVKLAKNSSDQEGGEDAGEEAVESGPDEERVDKVVILSTPTGFLRVRSQPSTLSDEVGTVEPGKEYELIDTDKETDWFKIRFIESTTQEEKEGWITNQYAKIVDPASATPTVSPQPTP